MSKISTIDTWAAFPLVKATRCGRYWDRTSDLFRVNPVLRSYQYLDDRQFSR